MNTISRTGKQMVTMIFFATSLFLSPFFFVANAQTTTQTHAIDPAAAAFINKNKSVIIASVSIRNLEIVKQATNTLSVAFNVINEERVQPAVIYGINLLSKDKNGDLTVIADSKIYRDDVLSLGENVSVHKEIVYTVPAYVKGSYTVEVSARHPDGLYLGFAWSKEKVSFDGSSVGGLYIDAEKCFLTVSGEALGKKYTPSQGVDVASNEVLLTHCSIKNNFTAQKTFIPTFKTYYRTTFGALISENSQEAITLRAGETRLLEIPLILAKSPQAYDSVLTFVNEQKEQISSPVTFHYVLRGESATIQNLTLDKDAYKKGDTAQAMFVWTGSADSFSGARIQNKALIVGPTVTLTIVNGKGEVCGETISKKLETVNSNGVVDISIPIIKDCYNPTVSSKIVNQAGSVLAENIAKIVSANSSPIEETVKSNPTKNDAPRIVILVLLLIVVLGGIYILKKRRGSKNGMKMFLIVGMMIVSGFFGGGKEVSAHTLVASGYTSTGDFVSNYYTYDLDADTYAPGAMITASGRFDGLVCSNGVVGTSGAYSELFVTINGTVITLVPRNTGSGINRTYSYPAPVTPGTYQATFKGYYYNPYPSGYWTAINHPYVISGPPSLSFSAFPSSITLGQSATLSWSSSNATGCTASGSWGGGKSTNGSESITPGSTGTFTYNLSCTGPGGSTGVQSRTVTVSPAGPSLTISMNISPPTTTAWGQRSSISWTSTGAVSCSGSPTATVPCWGTWCNAKGTSGTVYAGAFEAAADGGPAGFELGNGTYSFGMYCTNSVGTKTAVNTVTLNIAVPAPAVTFVASPTTIPRGDSVTMSWSSNNVWGTSCYPTTTAGPVTYDWQFNRPPVPANSTGSYTFVPSQDGSYTYQLKCSGPGGDTIASQNVTVLPYPPAVITSYDVSPTTLTLGGTTTLSWSSTDTDACRGMSGGAGWNNSWYGPGGSVVLTPASVGTYNPWIQCFNLAHNTASGSQSKTFTVTAPPASLTFDSTPASPATIVFGQDFTLLWDSTNAVSCTATGDPLWNGSKSVGTGNSQTISSPSVGSHTYNLYCTNSASVNTAQQTKTLTVSAVPPTISSFDATTPVVEGQKSTLTWTSADATSCDAVTDAGSPWSGSGLPPNNSGSLYKSDALAAGSYYFKIKCTGPGGTSIEYNSNPVTVTPPASSFAFSPNKFNVFPSPANAKSVTLYWTGTDNSCTRSSTPSTPASSPVWSGAHDPGTGSLLITPATTTTYKLTCGSDVSQIKIYYCGNSICEKGESFLNCPKDCKSKYFQF